MADTARIKSALQALLADNTTGDISAQDVRDVVESIYPGHGAMYISSAAATTIGSASTYVKVAGTTTATNLSNFSMAADNRLTYTGTPDVHVHVAVSLSMTSGSSNQVVRFRVGKTGSTAGADAVASTIARKIGTGTDIGSTAVHFDGAMSTNDYLELFISNETGANNVTIDFMYFFIFGMMSQT